MKEQLITLKTAKLAKEKGFKEYCRRIYVLSEQKQNDKIGKIHYRTETYFSNSNYTNEEFVSAPTQSLLQKWLREKHEIYVNIKAFNSNESIMFFCDYYDFKNLTIEAVTHQNNYEEALEKGLQEALKLI